MKGKGKEEGGPGREPETTRFEEAQRGNCESLNELMQRHEGLVHRVVQGQGLLTLPYEDALQAGRQGLWRAILGYDVRRGTTFATYAYPAIMRHVWRAVKVEGRRLRREVPIGVLAIYYYQPGTDPAWQREEQDIRKSLLTLVKRLPGRLRAVIRAYYGLKGEESQSLRAIGEQLGLSGERVRQLRNEALVWLSQPAHSQELRSLLARHGQVEYELADQMAQVWLKQRGGRNGRR